MPNAEYLIYNGLPDDIGILGGKSTRIIMRWWLSLEINPELESSIFTHFRTLEFMKELGELKNDEVKDGQIVYRNTNAIDSTLLSGVPHSNYQLNKDEIITNLLTQSFNQYHSTFLN